MLAIPARSSAGPTSMARRPLTHGEALSSWAVDSELRGGHTVQETLAFVDALADVEETRPPPPGFVSPDLEPKWLTTLGRWFGR